jgi:predicted Zn-dependent protease
VKALPENPDAHEMLARVYIGLSNYAHAAAQYRALARLQPDSPRTWYGLARSYQAQSERALESLQTEAPDSPLLDLLVADVAVTQDKFAAALAIYRRVMASSPPVGGLHEAVADLYERSGHSDWAAIERAKAPKRPVGTCKARAAECHFLAGRYLESLEVALASTTAVGRYWTIRAANQLATEAVVRLGSLPESVELHLVRAETAQSRRQNPQAVRELRAALALNPGDPVLESALAEALLHAHDLDEAIPLLERLTRKSPSDPSLLLMLGEALLGRQEIDRAIPVLERAAAAPQTLPRARASLGRAYAQTGRFADALPHLETAATDDPDGEILLQLARAYQALQRPGDAQKAMAQYRLRQEYDAAAGPDKTPETELSPPE